MKLYIIMTRDPIHESILGIKKTKEEAEEEFDKFVQGGQILTELVLIEAECKEIHVKKF